MDRYQDFERWKRDIYPQYWSRASRKYGLDAYCAGLLYLIRSQSPPPKNAFELAIGNGFPFADNLASSGIDVAGCDISEDLVAELKATFPAIRAFVGGYADSRCVEKFDVVYCFRSSWHFPDIDCAIDFMLNIAKPNGVIIIDIMNSESTWNKNMIMRKNILFPVTILKNLAKYFLNNIWHRRWLIDKVFGVRDIMYSSDYIINLITARGLSFRVLDLHQVETFGVGYPRSSNLSNDQKLVFIISTN